MAAGDITITDSGKIGITSSGKGAVKDASDECSECCGGADCNTDCCYSCSGSIEYTEDPGGAGEYTINLGFNHCNTNNVAIEWSEDENYCTWYGITASCCPDGTVIWCVDFGCFPVGCIAGTCTGAEGELLDWSDCGDLTGGTGTGIYVRIVATPTTTGSRCCFGSDLC